MKSFLKFFIGGFLATLLSCSSAQSGDKKAGKMIFTETEHNFGNIKQNSVAEFAFVFKNTGKDPIIVSNVQTSCGCTVPAWSQEPVNKNQSGVIKVSYNTRIVGNFRKTINVFSNASNSPVTLRIEGTVVPENSTQENK
jgi:hypothetical protein